MKGLKQKAFEFFSMGTGGPHQYTGRDMRTAHANMNITVEEYDSATDDTLSALDENGIGQVEKNEDHKALLHLIHPVSLSILDCHRFLIVELSVRS